LGVGYSLEVSYALGGALPEGDYAIGVSASTQQAGSEPLHFELVLAHAGGGEQSLASGDTTIVTSPSGTAHATLHAQAIAPDCGDRLIVRTTHSGGTQVLLAVILTLDIP